MSEKKPSFEKVIHQILILSAILPATLLVIICFIGIFVLLGQNNLIPSEWFLLLSLILGFPGYVGLILVALGRSRSRPMLTGSLLGCGLLSIIILGISTGAWRDLMHLREIGYTIEFIWPFFIGIYFFVRTLMMVPMAVEEDDSILDRE